MVTALQSPETDTLQSWGKLINAMWNQSWNRARQQCQGGHTFPRKQIFLGDWTNRLAAFPLRFPLHKRTLGYEHFQVLLIHKCVCRVLLQQQPHRQNSLNISSKQASQNWPHKNSSDLVFHAQSTNTVTSELKIYLKNWKIKQKHAHAQPEHVIANEHE